MCWGGGGGGGQAQAQPMFIPAPIMSRNPNLVKTSTLPEKKQIVDEEEAKTIEYGSGKKGQPGQQQQTNASGLRIPLNVAQGSTGAGGGVNVSSP